MAECVMNKPAAIGVMEELSAKGWTFEMNLDKDGWRCEVVGAGLAHGIGCAKTFEDAVALALKNAASMEDDPAVIIAKYEAWIKAAILKHYGEIKYRIEAVETYHEWGPKRIQVTMEANADVPTMVDREGHFYRSLAELPVEIQMSLTVNIEWPEEKPAVVQA